MVVLVPSSRASRKMPRSPHWAQYLPIIQANLMANWDFPLSPRKRIKSPLSRLRLGPSKSKLKTLANIQYYDLNHGQ